MSRAVATGAAALLALLPRAASACAVCMSGRDDETRVAFLLTTLFLTLLPLVLVGSFVLWLRRRSRELERLEAESSPPAPARATGASVR